MSCTFAVLPIPAVIHRQVFIYARLIYMLSVQFSSVAQSCPTLWDSMNHSMPGLPVYHQLLEFTQTHVHRVGDAIQPSHSLLSSFLLPPNPPSIWVFSNESTLCMRCPKYWSFSLNISPSNEHPGLIHTKTCTWMFIATLLIIENKWENPYVHQLVNA